MDDPRPSLAAVRARIDEIDATLLDSGLIDKVRHAADELSQRLNYRPPSRSQYMKALGI